MTKNKTIIAKGTSVSIIKVKDEDYISITDMLKVKDGDFLFTIGLEIEILLSF